MENSQNNPVTESTDRLLKTIAFFGVFFIIFGVIGVSIQNWTDINKIFQTILILLIPTAAILSGNILKNNPLNNVFFTLFILSLPFSIAAAIINTSNNHIPIEIITGTSFFISSILIAIAYKFNKKTQLYCSAQVYLPIAIFFFLVNNSSFRGLPPYVTSTGILISTTLISLLNIAINERLQKFIPEKDYNFAKTINVITTLATLLLSAQFSSVPFKEEYVTSIDVIPDAFFTFCFIPPLALLFMYTIKKRMPKTFLVTCISTIIIMGIVSIRIFYLSSLSLIFLGTTILITATVAASAHKKYFFDQFATKTISISPENTPINQSTPLTTKNQDFASKIINIIIVIIIAILLWPIISLLLSD